ncbi:hypothetical protein [Kangiella sp.]|uniref:hypothetical protein n=1 Tax=Kangiella sp. TaxID=1920245 RepID=UPI0019A08121|nr:hypothetical protein [Kangiella sp.]MBD3652346.1 hypothetical protein [Kangiella sp.]
MNKHEYRLTWLFLLYGVIAVGGLSFGLPYVIERFTETNATLYSKNSLTLPQQIILAVAISHAFIVFCAGIYSYIKKTALNNFSLVATIILLIIFPIGTTIGVYYLWYRSNNLKLNQM